MLKRYLPLLAVLSFSAFAEVSFDEKKNRIEYLEELAKEATSMNIDAYRRELTYEKNNLPLEVRAEYEATLLAENVKLQVQRAFEAASESKSPEEASEEIKEAIEKDLEHVSPELRDEIRRISYAALDGAEKGFSHIETDLTAIEKVMLKGVKERSRYLNEEGENLPRYAMAQDKNDFISPSANDGRDAEKTNYVKKSQIIESLVSDRESARWVSTSNQTIKGDSAIRADGSISMQLKVEFMGVEVEAGPTIAFKKELKTTATVNAEGLNPILLPDGNFDFMKRDRDGKVVVSGGKQQKRFVNFTCEASLEVESEYSGGGGFSVAGIGAGTTVAKTYTNSVSLSSRRVVAPEYIDGKSVTIKYLNQLCHHDFLSAKITNTMTVAGSLNIMMKNVLSGLRFSHPKTKCVTDNHCSKWFNSQVALTKVNNVGRCVEERREKFRACELRGRKGQNCTVYDAKGQRLSDGKFEYTCDAGLRCVKVQQEGWLKGWSFYQYAKGKCQ